MNYTRNPTEARLCRSGADVSGDGKRLDFVRVTDTVCRWHIVELYTWNLDAFVNQCRPISSISTIRKESWGNFKKLAVVINFDWGKIRTCLMNKAVHELDFEKQSLGGQKAKKTSSQREQPWTPGRGRRGEAGWGMCCATGRRANKPGKVIRCWIKKKLNILWKFRFTCGKAFELEFEMIRHVF